MRLAVRAARIGVESEPKLESWLSDTLASTSRKGRSERVGVDGVSGTSK